MLFLTAPRIFIIMLARWWRQTAGLAAIEFALVFPILMLLLVGVFEFGTAFIINQKAITASQMMADLVSRNVAVTETQLNDIIAAGTQAMRPFPLDVYGYDIISVTFEGDNNDEAEPVVCWRVTENMTPRQQEIDGTQPLATLGEGVVVVTVTYTYRPRLGQRFFLTMDMRETAFARGRRSAVVSYQDGPDIGCEDV